LCNDSSQTFQNVEVEDELELKEVEKEEKWEKCGFITASVATAICTCLQVTPYTLWLEADGIDAT